MPFRMDLPRGQSRGEPESIRPMYPDGTPCSSMTFFFVPSCGTACSGHVTVPHKAAKVRASVRAFEDHPGCSKVKFLNPSELTCLWPGT